MAALRGAELRDLEAEADALLASAVVGTLPAEHPLINAPVEVLAAVAREVEAIGSNVSSITIWGGRDPHVEVRTIEPRNRPKLTETALAMGRLFEAPVTRQPDDPHVTPDVSYRQPPRHTHYKDDRRGRK